MLLQGDGLRDPDLARAAHGRRHGRLGEGVPGEFDPHDRGHLGAVHTDGEGEQERKERREGVVGELGEGEAPVAEFRDPRHDGEPPGGRPTRQAQAGELVPARGVHGHAPPGRGPRQPQQGADGRVQHHREGGEGPDGGPLVDRPDHLHQEEHDPDGEQPEPGQGLPAARPQRVGEYGDDVDAEGRRRGPLLVSYEFIDDPRPEHRVQMHPGAQQPGRLTVRVPSLRSRHWDHPRVSPPATPQLP